MSTTEIKQLCDMEREYILQVYAQLGNNKIQTAKALGISLKTLYNKLNLYEEQGHHHEGIRSGNVEQPQEQPNGNDTERTD